MSGVIIKNGIGFGTQSRAAFFDMGASKVEAKPFKESKVNEQISSVPWAKWGTDNKLPLQMISDIETCGILNSIIDGKARFAINNGILPALVHYEKNGQMVIDEILIDPEIDEFMEENNHFFQAFGWMKDQCAFSNGVGRIMLSNDKKRIAAFRRDDITEMRYRRLNDSGISENIFLCAEWDKVRTSNDERILKIPLLNFNNPLRDLREKADVGQEFAMTFQYPGWGKKYYPTAMWYAAKKWVSIAQGVPEMKAAIFENNFRPKYLVIISEKYWEKVFLGDGSEQKQWDDYTEKEIQEKKNKVYDDIDQHLAGNANAYKTIFADGYIDAQGKLQPEIDIRPIDDTTKQGELLPDSAAANSEIAFSLLFNPAIIGASMPSGPYTNSQGGSNVRESTLLQVIIHELERQNVRRFFNVIKRYNSWDKKAKEKQKLEFIIPATIPTTLDTGSNVKPMVTGASPSPENNSNGTN